jgi:hypothetical protein
LNLGAQDVWGACATPGDAHRTYVERFWTGTSHIARIVADGKVLYPAAGTSGVDPFIFMTGTPEVDFAEETHYIPTHVLGTPASPTHFGHLQVQNAQNDVWADACGNAYLHAGNCSPASQFYADTFPTCDSFNAWDTRG